MVLRNLMEIKLLIKFLAAAFDFSDWKVVRDELTYEITKHLLYSEYRTTILASWDHSIRFPGHTGSNKLYLIPLGGCVHCNPKEIICEAISRNIDVIQNSGLDVYLICFKDSEFQEMFQYLEETVKATNGNIISAK